MTDRKLVETEYFCIMPWTHMHTWPNGNAYMCCTADPNDPIGILDEQNSLKDLWNSERMKQNRLKMLNNEKVKECSRCYEIELAGGRSLRKDMNVHFSRHLNMIPETNSDGSLDKLNLPYIDFRFSNFCNLRCRTCGPDLSSKWAIDRATLMDLPESERKHKIVKPNVRQEIFWEQIEEILPSLETIYFAGGEPLLMEEHYRLLDLLIERGKTHNIELLYNTNFTVTKFKDKKIIDYWSKFQNVTVGASLDSWGSRAEYIRKDLRWDVIEKNFGIIKENCPHVKIFASLTLSVFNFATLVEYYDYMTENNFINFDSMNINIVTDPVWYKPSVLPLEYRQNIANKYQEKLDYLRENKLCGDIMLGRWQLAINYILGEQQDPTNLDIFIRLTRELDRIRNEKFSETFPELGFVFDE